MIESLFILPKAFEKGLREVLGSKIARLHPHDFIALSPLHPVRGKEQYSEPFTFALCQVETNDLIVARLMSKPSPVDQSLVIFQWTALRVLCIREV